MHFSLLANFWHPVPSCISLFINDWVQPTIADIIKFEVVFLYDFLSNFTLKSEMFGGLRVIFGKVRVSYAS